MTPLFKYNVSQKNHPHEMHITLFIGYLTNLIPLIENEIGRELINLPMFQKFPNH
jgi:hypothetical protein